VERPSHKSESALNFLNEGRGRGRRNDSGSRRAELWGPPPGTRRSRSRNASPVHLGAERLEKPTALGGLPRRPLTQELTDPVPLNFGGQGGFGPAGGRPSGGPVSKTKINGFKVWRFRKPDFLRGSSVKIATIRLLICEKNPSPRSSFFWGSRG